MQMKVDRACGRCGKVTTVEVDMEGAQQLIKEDQLKKEALIAIDEYAAALDPAVNPEIIIITKNAGGYDVDTLDSLCLNPDNKTRFRGCALRVKSLLDDVFNRAPKKTTSKKSTKKKEGDKGEN